MVAQSSDQFPAVGPVVDPEKEVAADVGGRPLVQSSALDVVQFDGWRLDGRVPAELGLTNDLTDTSPEVAANFIERALATWSQWSEAMRKSADELADAAKAKAPAAIKTAAAKLNSTCNNCHGVFRD